MAQQQSFETQINISTDKFIYNDAYPAFKAGTDQKEITSRVNQAFYKNLQKSGIVLTQRSVVKVADIGCGPGDTIIKYLSNIMNKFDIRATDYSPFYAGNMYGDFEQLNVVPFQMSGEAFENILKAKLARTIDITDFTVKRGDAFAGKLKVLLSKDSKTDESNTFNIVYMSHCIYHATSDESGTYLEKVDRVLSDIANNLLALDGLAILIHSSYTHSEGPNRANFHVDYGNNSRINSPSDIEVMYDNIDSTRSIVESCEKQRIPFYELGFVTQMYFNKEIKKYSEIFKDPSKYWLLRSNPEILADYHKLSFMTKRAPSEMARDKSSKGLTAFIEDIMSSLHENEKGQWYIPNKETMHVLLNPKSTIEFREMIKAALDQTAAHLPDIIQQGVSDFKARTQSIDNQNYEL